MVNTYHQNTLSNHFQECKDSSENDKPKFLKLLSEHLDLASLVPLTFFRKYNKNLGRDRSHSLLSMLAALMLQKILGIPTTSLLIIFLNLSKEAREFCGFDSVPGAYYFSRFKKDFITELENLFNHLVEVTEPICHKIDSELASTLAFDTSGIEAYVTENNPKFINSVIKRLKQAYKNNPEVDIYKMAYGLMPSHAQASEEIKQLYINGYFCYVYKFAIITNGLGIPRSINLLDKDFKEKHPEIVLDKKSDSPDEDKSISDLKSLKPVLQDFFKLHPDFTPHTFLGDSIFDSYATYPMLMNDFKFKKVLIPLNNRNSNSDSKLLAYDVNGWPLCPSDHKTALKPIGWTKEPGRSDRFKWKCPKAKFVNGKYITSCTEPCNGKPYGRVTYTSPTQDYRLYPGVIRDSDEWESLYKTRVVVEKNIHYIKEPMSCGNLKTRDKLTIKSDLYLAGIAQLLTVVVAWNMNQHQYLRSLKKLVG